LTRSLPSFQRLLFQLALGCILPITAVAVGVIVYQYRQEKEQTGATAVATARALIAGVDGRLHGLELALNGLSKSPWLNPGTLERFQDEAAALQRSGELSNIVLVDPSGRETMNTRVAFGMALPEQAMPEMLLPIRTGHTQALDLFRGPVSGLWTAGIGVPVMRDGVVTYGLNANIDLAVLQDALARQKLPAGWIAAVLDSKGTIVARTHAPERNVGTPARAALIERIRQVPEDAVESVTVDGVPVVTAFSRSPHYGWSVVIGIPRDELQGALIRSLWLLLAAVGLALALTLALSRRLARRISGSIEALGAAARGAGLPGGFTPPPAAFLEAEQLSRAFQHASAALQDAHSAIAEKEARLSAIVETATDAIVTVDDSGHVVLFNRSAQEMFGRGPDEMMGLPLAPLLEGDSQQPGRPLVERLVAHASGVNRIARAVHRSGRTFPVELSVSGVVLDDERRLYTIILRAAPAKVPA
jgi:PAS domain S-box-containing protein